MNYFYKLLPDSHRNFQNKSLSELQEHADALILGMQNIVTSKQQPFLMQVIDGVKEQSFSDRKERFQEDGMHLNESSYDWVAQQIVDYLEAQQAIFAQRSPDVTR